MKKGRKKDLLENLFNKPEKGKVRVKSKTYDHHDRAARGTLKPAVVNSKMKEMGERMISSNKPAKLIFDAIKPFRENFKGGLFWHRLVKHFTGQATEGKKYDVAGLENHDLNENYPLSRLMGLEVKVNQDMPALAMTIEVTYFMSKRFIERNRSLDSIQFTFIGLFPDFNENDISVVPVVSPARKLNGTNSENYSFIMNIPVTATSFLIICKFEGCKQNKIIENLGPSTKSMHIVAASALTI